MTRRCLTGGLMSKGAFADRKKSKNRIKERRGGDGGRNLRLVTRRSSPYAGGREITAG